MKTLLVEDNERNAYLLTFLLQSAGFTVTHAGDGKFAMELVGQQRFELILLDIQLPGMDGYAVARAIRQLCNGRNTPIIAVTSHALLGDDQKAFDAGCNGYIEKPIDPETFVRQILAIVQQHSEVEDGG